MAQWIPVCLVLGFFDISLAPWIELFSEPATLFPSEELLQRERELMAQSQSEEWITRAETYQFEEQYDLADHAYRQALRFDPRNSEIVQNIRQVEKLKFSTASERYRIKRDNALTDVAETWNVGLVNNAKEKENAPSRASHVPNVLRQLENTRFAVLDFQEADVRQVIAYLAQKSREMDSKKEGVNFVMQLPSMEKPTTISMSLRDVSLLNALDFIRKISGIRYRVEEYAVVIFSSESNDASHFFVREFTVQSDFFEKGKLASDEEVSRQFVAKGIPFAEGASASYFPNTSKLVVRGTPGMLEAIQNLITRERAQLPQVEIETRFIEFSEDKLEELRFRWQVGANADIPPLGAATIPGRAGFAGHTAGIRGVDTDDLTLQPGITQNSLDQVLGRNFFGAGFLNIGGILDGHGMRLLVNLMHRVAGANLMSAPKITIKKGEKGAVRIAREFVYPRKYASPVISDEDGLVIPSNPEDFNFNDPRNIGVMLKVAVEEVNPDLGLIDLKLEDAQVTEFDGFIDYGNSIVIIPQEGEPSMLSAGTALQPVFSVRRAQTNIQLRDGQTLVMGGFIREDAQSVNDSVPMLSDVPVFGRLFKGKSDQSIKRNLMIMSTARLVYSSERSSNAIAKGFQP
ncbi:MAG: hypothetical protein ACOY3I_07115 [Verrucomicrobiota bacterium]